MALGTFPPLRGFAAAQTFRSFCLSHTCLCTDSNPHSVPSAQAKSHFPSHGLLTSSRFPEPCCVLSYTEQGPYGRRLCVQFPTNLAKESQISQASGLHASGLCLPAGVSWDREAPLVLSAFSAPWPPGPSFPDALAWPWQQSSL